MLQRLDLVLNLENPFNYDGFVSACLAENLVPLTMGEYSQKIGMLKVAMNMFPSDQPRDAYLRFIKIMSTEWVKTPAAVSAVKNVDVKPCGSCGGGGVV